LIQVRKHTKHLIKIVGHLLIISIRSIGLCILCFSPKRSVTAFLIFKLNLGFAQVFKYAPAPNFLNPQLIIEATLFNYLCYYYLIALEGFRLFQFSLVGLHYALDFNRIV